MDEWHPVGVKTPTDGGKSPRFNYYLLLSRLPASTTGNVISQEELFRVDFFFGSIWSKVTLPVLHRSEEEIEAEFKPGY